MNYAVKIDLNVNQGNKQLINRVMHKAVAQNMACCDSPDDNVLLFGFHQFHQAQNFYDDVKGLKTWFAHFAIHKPTSWVKSIQVRH